MEGATDSVLRCRGASDSVHRPLLKETGTQRVVPVLGQGCCRARCCATTGVDGRGGGLQRPWKNSTNFVRNAGLWRIFLASSLHLATCVSPRLLLEEIHSFYVEVVPEPFALEIGTFSTCSSYGGVDGFSAHFAPFFSDSVHSDVNPDFWSPRWPPVVGR